MERQPRLRRRVVEEPHIGVFRVHAFYVRQLRPNGPIFVYRSLPEWASGRPSSRVLQYVNGERCDDFIGDFDNIQDILLWDGASKAVTVVETIDVGIAALHGSARAPRRRAVATCRGERPRRRRRIGNAGDDGDGDDDDDDDDNDVGDDDGDDNGGDGRFMEIRQYWDAICCIYCNAPRLLGVKNRAFCCSNGKNACYNSATNLGKIAPLHSLPIELLEIALNPEEMDAMDLLIMNYTLDFAVTTIQNPRQENNHGRWEPSRGGSITMQGRVYRFLKDSATPDSLDFYMTGGVAAQNRLALFDQYGVDVNHNFMDNNTPAREHCVDEFMLRRLSDMLFRDNQLARELKMIADMDGAYDPHTTPINTHVAAIRNKANVFDVAATQRRIHVGRSCEIFVRQYDENIPTNATNIDLENPFNEALSYPLLFPSGDVGWGKPGPDIEIMDYMRCRMLQPEPYYKYCVESGNLIDSNYLGFWTEIAQPNGTSIPFYMKMNRFQCFSILSQYWMVDMYSRSIDRRISYQRSDHVKLKIEHKLRKILRFSKHLVLRTRCRVIYLSKRSTLGRALCVSNFGTRGAKPYHIIYASALFPRISPLSSSGV